MVHVREVTAEEAEFEVSPQPELVPVRGNALASGDDDEDRKYEEEILRRLGNGDPWASCVVVVTATWNGFAGRAALGGCSYRDRADFCTPDGYYPDLKA